MDVPYEVRMKYIIQAYKKDQERWADFPNIQNIWKER